MTTPTSDREKIVAEIERRLANINPIDRTIDADLRAREILVEQYESLKKFIAALPAETEGEHYVRVRIDGDEDVYYKDMYDAIEHLKESGKHGTAVPVQVREMKNG